MKAPDHFVIIDDDEFNNRICSVTLSKLLPGAFISAFIDPVAGFEHIVTAYSNPAESHNCILFLDINMPLLNGWDFLANFEKLSDEIKSRVSIYILSSSVDKKDIDRANQDKNVIRYLIKPLNKETIKSITMQ